MCVLVDAGSISAPWNAFCTCTLFFYLHDTYVALSAFIGKKKKKRNTINIPQLFLFRMKARQKTYAEKWEAKRMKQQTKKQHAIYQFEESASFCFQKIP